MKTIIFVFAGRKANMELQLPHIRRILQTDPDVEYHIWDLSRNDADHQWLPTITGERIVYHGEFYGGGYEAFNAVFLYYTRKQWREYQFVKIDEDIVFMEDANFGNMIGAVEANPDIIISAKLINNGACTWTFPELFDSFPIKREVLSQVHRSPNYAITSHRYFLDNWRDLIDERPQLLPVPDWLSINMIGFSWQMLGEFAAELGGVQRPNAYTDLTNVPAEISTNRILGDEGVINLFPRFILQGFIACHLYYGPQRKVMRYQDIAELHKHYRDIGRQYPAEVVEHERLLRSSR